MCGILAIVNNKITAGSENLLRACSIIRHRGPDDEGFLTWAGDGPPTVWAGNDTAASTLKRWNYQPLQPGQHFKVGFGHRRLSILDLSPGGHQPMQYTKAGLAITFNGEIYNYIEIKAELEKLGHRFSSVSDTEVILHAWEQWGAACLNRFNGMFSFVLLDYNKGQLYAVRDRFGVKPLFYYKGATALYLASEIKQIRTSPDYQFALNETVARQFLATGAVNHTASTFDTQVKQLSGGHYLQMDLTADTGSLQIKQWYELKPEKWAGSYEDATGKFKSLLTDAVSMRLRSDVTVGSCLSGGLDSSSIVCIAADLLKARGDFAGQETVTACFDSARYDEWKFAEEVIKKTGARPHRVFPSFPQLLQEIDSFLWHQDEPTGSTSQFSQWAVFKGTHEAGLKVMIDGQGADEQLAGYGGNDIALYSGLLKKAHFASLLDEAIHYKKDKGAWPKGFLLAAMQANLGPSFSNLLPARYRTANRPVAEWMQQAEPASIFSENADSLRENLIRQLYSEPLPALLRYEDHNSMAWSVESRTPFMDYRLIEFTLGLPERFIYKRGVRKTILRDAMHNVIPSEIENRKDKMGFVTPEELWLKTEGKEWFKNEIDKACRQFDFLINGEKVKNYVGAMMEGKREFNFMPWRIISFSRCFGQLHR